MPHSVVELRSQLREAGLRVTGPRLAVLEWLDAHPHATADEVRKGVIGDGRRVSTQAVYDVLAACTWAGLVRSIEPAGHPARYERRAGDNHHHLVCRNCGRIEDVDCVVGERPCMTPANTRGYAIDEAEVVFWGICGECAIAVSTGPNADPAPPSTQSTSWQP